MQDPSRHRLTAAQASVWYAQELDQNGPGPTMAECLLVEGDLDLPLLEQSFRQALDEAESWRTSYESTADGLRQTVSPLRGWRLPIVDLRTAPDPMSAADDRMRAALRLPVNLTHSPVTSATLFLVGPEKAVLFLRAHHIATDSYGYGLWLRRASEIYCLLTAGQTAPVMAFPTVAQIVADEDHYRTGNQFETDRRYWREVLTDRPEPVTLAGRTASASNHPHRADLLLPVGTADRLRDLTRSSGVALPALLIGALGLYVHRLTGADEVMTGLPVLARTTSLLRRAVSSLANQVPLRIRAGADMTVRELARGASRQAREALRHQRYPHSDICRDLAIPGSGPCE